MKLLRGLLIFLLLCALLGTFVSVLAVAVTGTDRTVDLSTEPIYQDEDADSYTVRGDKGDLAATGASYTPRLSAPAAANKYYYSDANIFYRYGWGMPNCTCYAWGRAYEILGSQPQLSTYSAYLWYDYNKDNKIYSYGQTPKLGAIACWVYSSGYAGHVAVVEKITSTTVTFSNSAWGGEEFYLSTAPVSDPSNGRDTWIFQGYIYIGNYTSSESTSTSTTTTASTTAAGDVYRITSDNGVNLRKTAGTSGEIIGSIGYGQDVTVTKTAAKDGYTWGYTTYGSKSGWFVTDFAKLIYRRSTTTTTTTTATTTTTTTATSSATESVKATEPAEPVTEEPLLYGDVNEDGDVNIMDATRMQLILVELMIPTEHALIVGDYDGDSRFSIMDVNRLQLDLVRS